MPNYSLDEDELEETEDAAVLRRWEHAEEAAGVAVLDSLTLSREMELPDE